MALPLTIVRVTTPGTVAARNAGLDVCTSDVLCIVDDDTEPQPEWLAVVLRRFVEDPALGGLGGRDRCFDGTAFDDRQEEVVGRIQWHGRMIGNHHLGYGAMREVDFLKGANMSFRIGGVCAGALRYAAEGAGRTAAGGYGVLGGGEGVGMEAGV